MNLMKRTAHPGNPQAGPLVQSSAIKVPVSASKLVTDLDKASPYLKKS